MKKLILFSLFALALQAQTPDCSLPINVPTGSAVPFNLGPFDNRTAGCTTWQITYNSTGFSALSILVQTAPNSSGAPGSWSTFTAVSGSNPNTATDQAVSTFGSSTSYFPWLRVQLTSKTGAGTISGRLYGWRIPPSGGSGASGCVGTAGTPCVVAGPDAAGAAPTKNAVQIAGFDGTDVRRIATDSTGGVAPATSNPAFSDGAGLTQSQPIDSQGNLIFSRSVPYVFNGLTLDMQGSATRSAIINTSASGATELVALSGVKVIRIYNINWSTASPISVSLVYGSGVACGTGTTALTGTYANNSTFADNFFGSLRAPSAKAVCINLGSAVSTTGVMTYGYFPD